MQCEWRSFVQRGEGMEERFEYIRCLFCVTGREQNVVRSLESTQGLVAVFPQKLKPIWRKGGWTEELFTLFPGYVFVYSHRPILFSAFGADPNVVRALSYDKGGTEGYLVGRDRDFALSLLRSGGVIGALDAVQEGDQVRICEGALLDCIGRVVKVDRRKRLAKVEMEIMGDLRGVWLAYQLLEDESRAASEEKDARPEDGRTEGKKNDDI